jgi:hypothetical protein
VRAFLLVYEARLTRFDPASELCSLNRSPQAAEACPAVAITVVETDAGETVYP